MSIKLFSLATLLGFALGQSNAATVTVENDITSFLSGPFGLLTRDVTFTDVLIGSVTLRFTITTLTSEGFTALGDRVGVGPGGPNDDSNHFDSGEDVTFDVAYLSSTGDLDLSSIAFRFDQIGLRGGGSTQEETVTWKVNGDIVTSFASGGAVPGATESYRALDSVFTTIGSTPGLYSATISTLRTGTAPFNGTSQFSRLTGGTNTGGIQFSADFVPEPSSAMLAVIGILAVLRRRR